CRRYAPLMELDFLVGQRFGGLASGLDQHAFRTLDSCNLEALLSQGNSMITRAASHVQDGADRTITISLEQPLYHRALGKVVFVLVEGIIGIGINRTEHLIHESISWTTLLTWSNCFSVKATPEGR